MPSFTQTSHNASYPRISPSRSELSARDKTVVITGGGTGIGASIALAFATAGSKKFALLGRRVGTLQAASKNITQSFPDVHILAISTDVTDKAQVDAAFDTITNELGPVDTLVSNAGYMGSPGPLVDGNVVEAWKEFEVHVKGSINVAQAFARTASKQGAVAIHTSTLSTILPGIPNVSTYTASKLAANKIWDSFGAENPGIRVVSFHPGIIETAMSQKNGFKAHDDVDLAGHFAVWLASHEATFLNGKFVCANWDVDELIARKDEFEKSDLGTLRFNGFS